MRRSDFEKLVEGAILALPASIRGKLDNVGFVIEDEPPPDWPEDPGDGIAVMHDDDLLGLYEGVSLADREFDYMGVPDKISIYVGPHLRMAAEDGEDLADIVRDTVWHEIGHHLGFDDAAIEKMEEKWGSRRSARGTGASCSEN